MKPRKCEVCGKIPKVSNVDDAWTFECGCGRDKNITCCGYKTKGRVIEVYNALYNDLRPQIGDVIITIRITKENKVSIGCSAMVDDYRERFLNNKDEIIDSVEHFMDFIKE